MRAKLVRSLATETLSSSHYSYMADDHTDSDAAFALLADDDETQELSKAIIILNKNVAALTNSVQTMGESIAEIRQSTSTATVKRDSRAVACSQSKAKRQRKAPLNDASDAEIQALLAASPADNQAKDDGCESAAECDEEDEFLKTLAAEYLSEDQTSSPVSAQFATILDKSWSASLSDTKLKEKLAKYDRPENCERLLAPKVNPEIWSRISNLGQRQDLKFVAEQKALASAGSVLAKSTQVLLDRRQINPNTEENSQWDTILTSQIDAIALLGHANFQLSLRRREMLKPFLKKEYASLCSSQTVVSSLLFGDELQSQLAAIRASNRISNTAIDPERGSASTRGAPSARSWRSRNTDRERPFFYKSPYPRSTNKSNAAQQKPRRGANKKY